jgi:hypothetical protein
MLCNWRYFQQRFVFTGRANVGYVPHDHLLGKV